MFCAIFQSYCNMSFGVINRMDFRRFDASANFSLLNPMMILQPTDGGSEGVSVGKCA